MTDPIALARAQLEEIAQLLPEYRDWLDLTGIRGHGLNLAAVTSLTGSPVETALIRREHENAPLDALQAVLDLHKPFKWSFGYKPVTSGYEPVTLCRECAETGKTEPNAEYPCPTVRAIQAAIQEHPCRN